MRPVSRWAVLVPLPGLSGLQMTLVSRVCIRIDGLQDWALVSRSSTHSQNWIDLLPAGHPHPEPLVSKDHGWHTWVHDDHWRSGTSMIVPTSATMRILHPLRISALPYRSGNGLLLHGGVCAGSKTTSSDAEMASIVVQVGIVLRVDVVGGAMAGA